MEVLIDTFDCHINLDELVIDDKDVNNKANSVGLFVKTIVITSWRPFIKSTIVAATLVADKFVAGTLVANNTVDTPRIKKLDNFEQAILEFTSIINFTKVVESTKYLLVV